jgi:hypothetical protein
MPSTSDAPRPAMSVTVTLIAGRALDAGLVQRGAECAAPDRSTAREPAGTGHAATLARPFGCRLLGAPERGDVRLDQAARTPADTAAPRRTTCKFWTVLMAGQLTRRTKSLHRTYDIVHN